MKQAYLVAWIDGGRRIHSIGIYSEATPTTANLGFKPQPLFHLNAPTFAEARDALVAHLQAACKSGIATPAPEPEPKSE